MAGRAGDLHRIGTLVDATAAGTGSLLIVPGPAGIGKSALLDEAVAAARTKGFTTLVADANELEQEFAFGIARRLFEAHAGRLDGAARRAAPVLGFEPTGEPELYATLHALYWLLVNVSATAPVLVAVDDAQWMDEPSLRWLAYVARRIEGVPVMLAMTVRAGSATDRPELEDLLAHEPATRIRPGPLDTVDVAAVLEARLGRAPEPDFTEACTKHTGGNPFLLGELVAELRAADLAPVAANVGGLAALAPDRVGASVRRRLARLDASARGLAEAVAVLGSGADLPLAAALAGLEEHAAAQSAAALVTAEVLADTQHLRFRHPLLRTVVEAAIPAPERVNRHARAAELLAARQAPSGRIAAHLLAAGGGRGDPRSSDHLRAAAHDARAQGVAGHAATLLRRALEEPPPPELRPAVLRELGEAELTAFDERAAEHLRAALAATQAPAARAEIAPQLVVAEFNAGRTAAAVRVALLAVEETRDDPVLREQWLKLEALLALVGRYDLATEAELRGRIHAVAAPLTGMTVGERAVLATAAGERPGPTAADLARTTRQSIALQADRPWPFPATGVGDTALLLHADHPQEAATFVRGLVETARQEGSPVRHAYAITARGMSALDGGDLRAATADFEDARRIWRDLGTGTGAAVPVVAGVIAFPVLAYAESGAFEEADRLLVQAGLDGELPEQMVFNPLLHARGSARLLARRIDAAEADLRELGRRHALWDLRRPSPPWRSSLAVALVAQGRRAEARELAREELELARVWATARSIARAERALALAADDPAETIAGLTSAEERLASGPWRLDRARVRCELGAALRRTGERRAARALLLRALDEAHACGAEVLAGQATDELRASGARPRRRALSGHDALTPSEQRVAELAGRGRTNREIAQELFVTVATVETHLSRVYRKLGVPGRTELAVALAERDGETERPT
ncbi:AAA family ATPase [Solirubrobacter taibaiensis]|nr:AAA family ATPase [Solirubrobacter taibaiensis]